MNSSEKAYLMKGDPALQTNLKELKVSLTTLKNKLGTLDKKLGDLKARLKKTDKRNPDIEKAIGEADAWIKSPVSIKAGISALNALDAQILENPTDKSLEDAKLKLSLTLGKQATSKALDDQWTDSFRYGTKFSHAITALKSIAFLRANNSKADFLNLEDKIKAKAKELLAEASKESQKLGTPNWIEAFTQDYKKMVPETPIKEKPTPEEKKPAPEITVKRINYGKKSRETFFKDFMGIDEGSFNDQKIKDQIVFEEHGGPNGKPNFKIKDSAGKVYQCGFLEQINLGELKIWAKAKAQSLKPEDKKPIIFNVIEASDYDCSGPVDIGKLQADPENKNAIFQVASNFNALETLNHNDLEDVNTIKKYYRDRTQGPRASISAAPGLIYRRYYYFYPERKDLATNLWGQRGQNNNNNIDAQGKLQINFLEDLPVSTMNGYIWGKDGSIEGKPDNRQPSPSNIENIKEENSTKFKIGYHTGIQVTFGETYSSLDDTQDFFYDPSQIIDQVFAAALVTSHASQQPKDQLAGASDERAKLILEWSYEAMLKAAFLNGKPDEHGKIKVFLTRIGGGAFANDQAWIDEAIKKAVEDPDLANSGLVITLNNFVFREDPKAIRERLIKLTQENNGAYTLYNADGAYSLTLVGDAIQETKIAK